jgi:RNA polymerase sigma factor (sigma-70 family)
MTTTDLLTAEFERHRPRMQAVAYRMLGSLAEAEDAVQEAWLRYSRTGIDGVENIGAWLTTIVARVSLNLLKSRSSRREVPPDTHVPDPVVTRLGPEDEAVQTDAVGLAMLVVLDTLSPDERIAFVLHDLFAVPFDDIAGIVGKSPAATRQLASRGRRRVQGSAPRPDADLARQREVVRAFVAASRSGDFEALLAVLDPDIVLRADYGATAAEMSKRIRGARQVAEQAILFRRYAPDSLTVSEVTVNGAPGVFSAVAGEPVALMAFAVAGGLIVEINILADTERLAPLHRAATTG